MYLDKQRSVIFFVLIVVLFFMPGPVFSKVMRYDLYGVQVMGEKVWVVGYKGTILYSGDRGESWQLQQSNTRESLFDVFFIDDQQGWAVGSYGAILHTKDGGRTWEMQSCPKGINMLFEVCFTDAEHGWSCGPAGTVIKTVDGGATWEKLPQVMDFDFYSISFVDTDRGVAAGEFGIIYTTEDGGRTWVKRENPVEISFLTGSQQCIFQMIAGEKPDEWCGFYLNGGLLISKDGMQSWQRAPQITENHFYNGAFDNNKLWVVGQRGTLGIYDQGKVEMVESGTKMDLLQVAFSSDGYGLAVGCRGALVKTLDRGKTWKPIRILYN